MIIMETWSALILGSKIFGTWLIYQCTVHTFVFSVIAEPLEVFKWCFGSDYKISIGTFPCYPSIALAHAQMSYFEIWLDFTDKLFGISKRLLSFTGYRHVVTFNFLKVYLLKKKADWWSYMWFLRTPSKIVFWSVNYTPVTPMTQPTVSPIVITLKRVVPRANFSFISYIEAEMLG